MEPKNGRQVGVNIGDLNHSVLCPDCGASMRLRKGKSSLFYGCSRFPDCRATHPARIDGSPIGEPASKELRELRKRAAGAFGAVLKQRPAGVAKDLHRERAYALLAAKLGIPVELMRFSEFTEAQCREALEVLGA